MTAATRATIGSCAAGLALGWCIANTGAVANDLARDYGVGLTAIGLLTTALFVAHLAFQLPSGRLSDRFGARRTALAGVFLIAVTNGAALATDEYALAIVARALMGAGTGLGFVAASDYVRSSGGSALAQGLFGGIGLGGGGLALVVVPQVEDVIAWRAPYATALAAALAGLVALLLGPLDVPRGLAHATRTATRELIRDRRLHRLAAIYAASFGLSVIAGNWVVTLLERAGASGNAAGAAGALTLLLGIVTRPLGGWLMRERPRGMALAVMLSFAGGAVGCLALAATPPLAVAAVASALVGLAAGIPFAPAFTAAAQTRPDAPAAAVALVNAAASAVIVAGTPLVGLTFSLPGDGAVGFVVMAGLWVAALVAAPAAFRGYRREAA
jgi:NNP family nitrate/nitrite transporter-like MFS transporter